jgi:hypothetical protein
MGKKVNDTLEDSMLDEMVDVAYWLGYYDGLKAKNAPKGNVKGKKGYSGKSHGGDK